MIKKTIEFIKGTNAPVFGLMTVIFGLFQMYAKTYYSINPFPIYFGIDIIISIVVAFGFSIATTIIIVHNQKKNTPIMFAIFDFLGYVLFFANNAMAWYNNGDFAKIGGAFFIAMLSAFVVYHFGEIFISQLKDAEAKTKKEQENQETENKEILALRSQIKDLAFELSKANEQLDKTTNEHKKTTQESTQATQELQTKTQEVQNLTAELQTKTQELQELSAQLQTLRNEVNSFYEGQTPESLKGTLKGLKSQFTNKIRKGIIEGVEDVKNKANRIASKLNLSPIDWIDLQKEALKEIELQPA